MRLNEEWCDERMHCWIWAGGGELHEIEPLFKTQFDVLCFPRVYRVLHVHSKLHVGNILEVSVCLKLPTSEPNGFAHIGATGSWHMSFKQKGYFLVRFTELDE